MGVGTTLLFATYCALAAETSGDVCPVKVEIAKSGEFYTNRFSGHYKTSAKLLERDLHAGCYNDANPSKVTSVTLRIVPGAPPRAVNSLYQLLDRNGWPKSKLKVVP
jgi:hypothetical protein